MTPEQFENDLRGDSWWAESVDRGRVLVVDFDDAVEAAAALTARYVELHDATAVFMATWPNGPGDEQLEEGITYLTHQHLGGHHDGA